MSRRSLPGITIDPLAGNHFKVCRRWAEGLQVELLKHGLGLSDISLVDSADGRQLAAIQQAEMDLPVPVTGIKMRAFL